MELEHHYDGEPQATRLRVLRLMKEDPSRTAADIALLTGCSERSIRRWWASYMQRGLAAIVELREGEKEGVASLDPRELELFTRKVDRGEFSTLDQAREWLIQHYGIRYSRSEVQFYLNRLLGENQRWTSRRNMRNAALTFDEASIETDGLQIDGRFIRFLNALPLTDDTDEWSRSFRRALHELFGDLDHIVINLNQTCNLTDPRSYQPTVVMRQHVTMMASIEEVEVTADQELGRPSEEVLREMERHGRPLNRYHAPHCFDYYYAGYAYIGTIFFFRNREKPPISEATLNMIDALEPFFTTAMANHVSWYTLTRPSERTFYDGLERLTAEAGLSIQEQRVAIYHLFGYSYDEMADLLGISAKTIKKHINTIHHKTGTRRRRELFARYLSPRIDFPATEVE